MLLAVIFDNFKKRIEIIQKKKVSHRMEYINMFFDAHDVDGNGWLNMKQTRKFFTTVLDLDYSKRSH